MITYKDSLTIAMEELAKNEKSIFLGYNVRYGSMANGTLKNVDKNKLIETPVAENLMAGVAIGMAIRGYVPLVYFERFDFILNALDAIVNHLDKIKIMSNNEYAPTVVIRAIVGATKNPLFTGLTHTQDLSEAISKMVTFPVVSLKEGSNPAKEYANWINYANENKTSLLMVEYRDLYSQEVK